VQLDIVYLYYGAVHHLRPSSLFDSFQRGSKSTIRGCRRNHLITDREEEIVEAQRGLAVHGGGDVGVGIGGLLH